VSNDVPLWFAVVLTLIPSVVAVAAIVAADLMDRRRLKHEREMRLRDERIAAYRRFLAATANAHGNREGVAAMAAAHSEVSLLASTDEIARVAYGVWVTYDRAQRIFAKSRDRESATKDPTSLVAQYRHRAEEERVRFLMLAQAELGLEGWSTGYRDAEWMSPDEALPWPEEGSQERREDASG
jgi:heme exporter protein D